MTKPRKLTIAAVVLLVCGVIVALVVRQPAQQLAISLDGVRPDLGDYPKSIASILLSNTGPRHLRVTLRMQSADGRFTSENSPINLARRESQICELPIRKPGRVFAESTREYSTDGLSDRVLGYLASHISAFAQRHTVTIDIP